MSKVNKINSENKTSMEGVAMKSTMTGRKRDHSLDEQILEATIDVLAETSFEGMKMDMVAARAKTGKATVYRRWASKAELVSDALIWMSQSSVELKHMPDTGSLRNDLLAVIKPFSLEHSERKIRVLSGLGSFFSAHKELAEETMNKIFDPWTSINRTLMQRAIERGELPPHADIEMACQIIVAITSHRSTKQCTYTDKSFFEALLDNILLPGLKSLKNN